ncbi:MAG TPA: tRNA (adenosine(37)-N6)-threonylcarbamoyltransferase complex ATPase subunit type 1 TsaE [Sedimenticola sp.]|nr:tRNA (adenosine(37)-N6)-threonylcarbamoyltransferase complex ATPase subunit type 1 TsaE [Sedimenticola sp.]
MPGLKVRGEKAQEALGAALAAACPAACVIYLEGDLGVGKTTLVRGFLRGLGHAGPVRSPTYTLLEPYDLPGRRCYHLDLYRLADPGELEYLGIRDLLQGDAILLVEWPEKGGGELPAADLIIHIRYDHDGRRLELEPSGARGEQLVSRLKWPQA